MKILIADNERAFVELLAELLTQRGNQVECAYDGLSALNLIKRNKYDIMLLDYNMPELTGLELVKYVKANKIETKTIMITGYADINKSFMKTIGVDEYLAKPVKLADIDTLIEQYSKK